MVGVKTHHYPLGVLFLHRSKNDPPFTRKEEQILDELVPYIAQALRQESGVEMLFTSSDKAGLLIFTKEGKLQHICPEGRRLLFLATHPVISKESLTGQSDKVIVPNELINLCSQLTALPKEQYGLIKAPVWKHQNQWGGFQFIPNWLEPHAGDSDGLVAVTIQYQEPQNFKVLRRCDELNLTAKQAEIGLKLVEGHSYETIAQQLKISQHTVIDHVKNIYTKLHIRSRSELIALLISS